MTESACFSLSPKLQLPEHRVTAHRLGPPGLPSNNPYFLNAVTCTFSPLRALPSHPLPTSQRCRPVRQRGCGRPLRPGGGGRQEADGKPPARPDADPEWVRSPSVAMATGPSAALALGQPPPPSRATVSEGGGAATGSTLSPNLLPSALPRAPALPPRPALTGGLGGLGGGAPTAGTILRAGA